MAAEFVDLAPTLIAAAAGLVGVLIGAWTTRALDSRRQRREFITKQLSEFYGPLLSMRAEVRAINDQRVLIQETVNRVWKAKIGAAGELSIQHVQNVLDEDSEIFKKFIEDENTISRDVLMPTYRQMLITFRDKMWLANVETRSYFPKLHAFVDMWSRYLRDALHADVMREIGHDEGELHPFYGHIEKVHDELQNKLR